MVLILIIIEHVRDLKCPLKRKVEQKYIVGLTRMTKKNYYIVCVINNYNNNNNNGLFLFMQAPPRLKSFISACHLMTQSVGNLLVIVVSALSFRKQVRLLYSALSKMLSKILMHLLLSYRVLILDYTWYGLLTFWIT